MDNTLLDSALKLARHFRVFPLRPGSKLPAISDFAVFATRKPEQVKEWWTNGHKRGNIGIARDGILPLDIDDKEGRNGSKSIEIFQLLGKELPRTFTQRTPTGGRHLIYALPNREDRSRNSIGKLASGLDVPGYVVGAGSRTPKGEYQADWHQITPAPRWLVEELKSLGPAKHPLAVSVEVDEDYAIRRARKWLELQPPVNAGQRDSTSYAVACYLKDLGVSKLSAYELMIELWGPRCDPPFTPEEIMHPVENSYTYALNKGPVLAPEASFQKLIEKEEETDAPLLKKSPVAALNDQYCFVQLGSGYRIMHETTDEKDKKKIEFLTEETFHAKFKNQPLQCGDGKTIPISKAWMSSSERREYEGVCFLPGKTPRSGYYNLWQGFAVEPMSHGTPAAMRARDEFLRHMEENVCDGSEYLFDYLCAFFADIVQNPTEKKDVALVLRGPKGVGKNFLVDNFGSLLFPHYFLASNRRYFLGNFNAHLEAKLFVTLDEASWAGDKLAEGTLKDLITGKWLTIERKGLEPYTVDNHLRLAILGNEEWLVPASEDERRFAVFDVGTKRQKDHAYFGSILRGLQEGGYSLLLRFFMDYKIAVELRNAPKTEGLLAQKRESADLMTSWWEECLTNGIIPGHLEDTWPEYVDCNALRGQIDSIYRSRHARPPTFKRVGMLSRRFGLTRYRHRENEKLAWVYRVPTLEKARAVFEKHVGQGVNWDEDQR